jgi:hypothetical protein
VLSGCSAGKGVVRRAPEQVVGDAGDSTYLGLSLPQDGFQIRAVGVDLEPGEEREYCEVAQLPGAATDEYFVSLIEFANGPSSHHLALAYADDGTPAAVELEQLGIGNHRECQGPLLAFGSGMELIGTTQVPYGLVSLPPRVARKFHGGELIVFDYHYANTSVEVVHMQSAANFHLVDRADVDRVAQHFSINNVTIDVPAGQTASFTAECHVGTDMMLGWLARHTHRLGTDFTVWYAGGARTGEEIWTSHDWQHDIEFSFPEPILVRAGEGFRYRCTFANDTGDRLRFGTSVKDEMCMLYSQVWPATNGGALDLPDCNIVWIDDQGIGHTATEAGGYPKPDASQVSLCNSVYGAPSDECGACRCESCANAGLTCAGDPDCAPLFECLAGCSDLACTEACQPVIRQHSTGEGPLTALLECVKVACPKCALVQ